MGVVVDLCKFRKHFKNNGCDCILENVVSELYGKNYCIDLFEKIPNDLIYIKKIKVIDENFYSFDTYIEWSNELQNHVFYKVKDDSFVSEVKNCHYKFKKVKAVDFKIKESFKGLYNENLFKDYIDVDCSLADYYQSKYIGPYILTNTQLSLLKLSFIKSSPIHNWYLKDNYNEFVYISW